VIHYGGFLEGAEKTRALVQGAGADTGVIAGNLETSEGIQQFISDVKQTAPEIDVLINNAGSLVQRANLAEYSDALFDRERYVSRARRSDQNFHG